MGDLTSSGVLREAWLVWLVLVFLAIVVWVLWPSRRRKLERQARIPLEDDNVDAGKPRPEP